MTAQHKAIYDIYGEYGLKEGCVTPEGSKSFRLKRVFGLTFRYILEKIGGGYFLKADPERYFEQVLSSTEFVLEDRATNGSDVYQSIFSDSFGALN